MSRKIAKSIRVLTALGLIITGLNLSYDANADNPIPGSYEETCLGCVVKSPGQCQDTSSECLWCEFCQQADGNLWNTSELKLEPGYREGRKNIRNVNGKLTY